MREIKWVPPVEEGEEKKFEGHIMIKCPTIDERMKNIESCGLQTDEKGQIKIDMSNISVAGKIASLAEKMIVKAELKYVEDGTEYTGFSDMADDPVCDRLLFAIGKMAFTGVRPGKNLNP